MMSQVALYARVSSERQADTNTIASQIAVLQERIQSDGEKLSSEMQFIDDGFSVAGVVKFMRNTERDKRINSTYLD